MDELFTLAEAAAKLMVSYSWLDRKIRENQIKVVWMGGVRRVAAAEIQRILREGVA